MNRHILIDKRIFALHELVVAELDKRPDFVRSTGISNLKRWKAGGEWCYWHEQWEQVLMHASDAELRSIILEKSERGDGMRHCAPFPGVITEEQRLSILSEYGSRQVSTHS